MDWPPRLPARSPLTIHPRGYVARVAGKARWICGKKPPDEALRIYHRKAAAWTAGTTPVPEVEAITPEMQKLATVHYVLARWLRDRLADAEGGELTGGAFEQYRLSAKRIDDAYGHLLCEQWSPDVTRDLYRRMKDKHGEDFAKRALSHFRTACRHAADHDWCRPLRVGETVLRRLTQRPQARMKWVLFTPVQIRVLLNACKWEIDNSRGATYAAAWVQLYAMIYLALNGGYGAKELSDLPRVVVDLDGARIDYARGKTGAEHVVPLWPETVEALRPVLAMRPEDELLFRTRQGNPWCQPPVVRRKGKPLGGIDNVGWAFRLLLSRVGMRGVGWSFYRLRHVHSSAADKFGDLHATLRLRGHALPGAAGHYVRVEEDRLRRLVEFLRHELLMP
jgi:integrase